LGVNSEAALQQEHIDKKANSTGKSRSSHLSPGKAEAPVLRKKES